MKIAFGMIVFESDFVLRQCLEAVYPFAAQIVVAEGPVAYWQERGRTTSTDDTNRILDEFPDPERKLTVIHGRWDEKEQQAQAYAAHLQSDLDYVWHLDADEVYKSDDIRSVLEILADRHPTSVGFQLCSFTGGLTRHLTGFEESFDTVRVLKWAPNATLASHRPPSVFPPPDQPDHVNGQELFRATGIRIYHYSYVFARQVAAKVPYYRSRLHEGVIEKFFERAWLPWAKGGPETRAAIEQDFQGLHEFAPEVRGPCFTRPFTGEHPEAIARDYAQIEAARLSDLENYQ